MAETATGAKNFQKLDITVTVNCYLRTITEINPGSTIVFLQTVIAVVDIKTLFVSSDPINCPVLKLAQSIKNNDHPTYSNYGGSDLSLVGNILTLTDLVPKTVIVNIKCKITSSKKRL